MQPPRTHPCDAPMVPEEPSVGQHDGRMTRQEFIIRLGAGLGALIAASFLVPGDVPVPPRVPASDGRHRRARPELHPDARVSRSNDLFTVQHGGGSRAVICTTNQAWEAIILRLDGRHTIGQLADAVSEAVGVPHTDALDAKVACFVAQLSMMGFLRREYRAFIVEQITA